MKIMLSLKSKLKKNNPLSKLLNQMSLLCMPPLQKISQTWYSFKKHKSLWKCLFWDIYLQPPQRNAAISSSQLCFRIFWHTWHEYIRRCNLLCFWNMYEQRISYSCFTLQMITLIWRLKFAILAWRFNCYVSHQWFSSIILFTVRSIPIFEWIITCGGGGVHFVSPPVERHNVICKNIHRIVMIWCALKSPHLNKFFKYLERHYNTDRKNFRVTWSQKIQNTDEK